MAEPLVVPESLAGERVDRAVAMLTGWSRSEVQALLGAGDVLIDGRPAAKSRRLAAGEVVELLGEPETDSPPVADLSVALDVRFEDADLVVLSKSAGIVVHPGPGHAEGTLVHGLLARYPEIAQVGDPARPGIVHRLDRDTSGLMMVARSARAYDRLVQALAERTVERRYLALVWGRLESRRGLIDAPIGRSARQPTRMTVRDGGREARTNYEVVEELGPPAVTLLECRLETGRTHQIRVHLAAIGHSVVGDGLYRGYRPALPLPRPFLHAESLGLEHPVSGEPLRFEDPLPPELSAVLTALRDAG
jgi:23S rRNA pseudouridine1911/1915/1917 synthase